MPPYYAVPCVGKFRAGPVYYGIIFDPKGDKSGDWVYEPDLLEGQARALAAWWDKHPGASMREVADFCNKLTTYRNLPERINPSYEMSVGVVSVQQRGVGVIVAAMLVIVIAVLIFLAMSV